MMWRRSTENHSLISRIADLIFSMKCYLFFIACLVVLFGIIFALPNDANLPIILNREFERVRNHLQNTRDDLTSNITNCMACSANPEEEMTTVEIIQKTGYPIEEHFVETEDGYILALHRIPGAEGSQPVLLHHALLESSFCWVINGKRNSLAYILADAGYDVWMGNSRGNVYSRNHTIYDPSNPKFWDFSWHEMGIYDLPAEINYIKSMKNDNLIYIGHSMGSTMFFAMASQLPDVAANVKAMFAFAPAVFLGHVKGPFRYLGLSLRKFEKSTHYKGLSEFFAQNAIFKFVGKCICNQFLIKNICRNILFSIVGYNPEQFNISMLPTIISHTPAGTSMKNMLHFSQMVESNQFLHYDYGSKANLDYYKSKSPPAYDLAKIQVPIAIMWGQNDYLCREKDVKTLYDKIPKKIGIFKVDDSAFNHLDFVWGMNARECLYTKLLHLLENYRHSNGTYSPNDILQETNNTV